MRVSLVMVLLAACAASSSTEQHVSQGAPAQSAGAEAPAPTPEPAAEVSAASVRPSQGGTPEISVPSDAPDARAATAVGAISRLTVNAVVEAGLGELFRHVQVSPHMNGKRFVGFRIAAIDPSWSGVSVAVGDVVLRVNGQSVARPEQAQRVFESLRSAPALHIECLRNGEPFELRYAIE